MAVYRPLIDRNLSRDRSTRNQEKYTFLDAIAESSKDRSALRGQIINILAAGRDTTACLLSWTFFLLVRHPEVMSKLRAEISSHDTSILSRSTLRNMPYLQNVLNETLRLYPSVPVNTRTAINNTILPTGGGPDRKSPVFVPKGSAIAYSVYSMHRRPDLYGMDAEIFRPERWDEDMPKDKDPTTARWGYLPFNGGPRICIGSTFSLLVQVHFLKTTMLIMNVVVDFALTEAAYTVVRILEAFPTILLPGGELIELIGVEKQTTTLVVSITNGCKVEIR
ncbi:hypothetical protein EG328_007980 [Venturia inaequalis]|uniref:Uncharacterized protein n=2 Tax=Venturia inaequalis TaxID=5025 RepID=A0A8H3VBN4_VENIN|nr:hypothetical protein EG328_007980 [Venturia inaequalis]